MPTRRRDTEDIDKSMRLGARTSIKGAGKERCHLITTFLQGIANKDEALVGGSTRYLRSKVTHLVFSK